MDPNLSLVQYGILGIVATALAVALIALWRSNLQLQKEKDAIQESRLSDAQLQNEKLIALSSQTSENVRILNDVLERLTTKRGK